MDEFEETLARIREEIVGKEISIPGYTPVGKVMRVDQEGAWLNDGGRINLIGLVFYHPIKDKYNSDRR